MNIKYWLYALRKTEDLETLFRTIILFAFALQYVCVSVVCQLKANNGLIDRFVRRCSPATLCQKM